MYPAIFAILLFALAEASAAATGSARVVVIRGTAATSDGRPLAENSVVDPGTTVITGSQSFVRLLFPDNTQLNLGPETTLKLEVTRAGQASLVDLLGGQLRAKVTKDILHGAQNGPAKDKMVIRTRTAAMGIRGTDFNVSYNPQNRITALITFEGNVAMARINAATTNPYTALLQPRGVQSVGAGQFSGAQPDMALATVPVRISPAQMETLKANDSFLPGEKTAKSDALASPIPPGVDPRAFTSGAEKNVQESMAKAAGADALKDAVADSQKKAESLAKPLHTAPPEGFFNKRTGEYAPRAGGFLDLSSGRYVPPPPGSSFDANTGVFVPPRAMGQFDTATGSYVPPKGVELDAVKGFIPERRPASADGSGMNPAQAQAISVAMNSASNPNNAGTTVSFDKTFAPTAANNGTFVPPPPPPPPPLPPQKGDDQTKEPTTNPCGTSASCNDNIPTGPGPVETSVNFRLNVTD